MVSQKYMITPNILYYDIYGRLEEKEPFREQFLLSVYEPGELMELRLVLSFGKAGEHLTLLSEGKQIKCTPGYGWSCTRTIDESAQKIYWDLVRNGKNELYYEPYLWISFSDIVIRKAGIAYLEVTGKEEILNKTFHEYIPIIKEQLPPRITRFSPVAATVRRGQKATLKWETRGASRCVLSPGNIVVDTSGTMEVQPDQDTCYVLDAIGAPGQEIVSESTRVYLYESYMENYLLAEPERYYWGSSVTVFYKAGGSSGSFALCTRELYAGKKIETQTKDLTFVVTADRILTAFQGAQRCGSIELSPDEREVIMRYVAAPIPNGDRLSFALGWKTVGAKEIQLFVRVYSMDKNRQLGGFCDASALITSEEEEGETVWSPDSVMESAKYLFFLRARNADGERKEAVYVYENETEVGYYDNLGK